jgi:ribosomal protein S18 acetylase RimI-like enzyme
MDIELLITDNKNTDFIELTQLLDEDLWARYGDMQANYDKHNTIDYINEAIIIYKNKIPVACGAFKEYNPDSAEIKRIFVKKENRQQGLAKLIISKIEESIKKHGYKYSILETGQKQQEAISLYKNLGYEIIENYAPYVGDSNSVCMKKVL